MGNETRMNPNSIIWRHGHIYVPVKTRSKIILTICTELVEDLSAQEYILDLEGEMCSSLVTCTKYDHFRGTLWPRFFLCNHLQFGYFLDVRRFCLMMIFLTQVSFLLGYNISFGDPGWIGPSTYLTCHSRPLNGALLRMRPQKPRHDKDPSLLKGQKCRA